MSKTTITYVPLDGNGQSTGKPVNLTEAITGLVAGPPVRLTITGPYLFAGDLFQVQDIDQTWHAAAVGPGVLCHANRDVSVQIVQWDYGTHLVDCPEPACRNALGRL